MQLPAALVQVAVIAVKIRLVVSMVHCCSVCLKKNLVNWIVDLPGFYL